MTDSKEKIAGEMREAGADFLNDKITNPKGEAYRRLHYFADRLLALRGEAVAWLAPNGRVATEVEVRFDGMNTTGWKPLYTHPSLPISEAVREAVQKADSPVSPAVAWIAIDKDAWNTIRAFLREQGVE